MKIQKLVAKYATFIGASTLATAVQAAEVVLINVDPPGVGLNDPTPVAPLSDNPGTTVGEQRRISFQAAADKWGATLESEVPIFIAAGFQPRPCNANGGVLASAGPFNVYANFSPEAKQFTWYTNALADALAGTDLSPGRFDAQAIFNSELGTPGCLENANWYYGLDGNEGPGGIDFLATATHELAHGLGFLELVDEGSGALFGEAFGFPLPDIYSSYMFDTDSGLPFTELTNEGRLAAQVSGDALVWTGENVTAAAPSFLGPRPEIRVLRPKSIRGILDAQEASFGPSLALSDLSGQLVLVDDGDDSLGSITDACEPIENNINGKIALIDRGGCAFTTKVLNAQAAGAKGVIVANNQPEGRAPMGGFSPDVTIPSVGVTLADGNAFKTAGKVNLKLRLNPAKLAGANNDGQVLLYAPNPVQPGSSKSHFDTSASPNLLMEPSITSTLDAANSVDLTAALFEDLGWVLRNP